MTAASISQPRPVRRALVSAIVGVVLVAVLAVLPLLDLSIPGILPGPTYTCLLYTSDAADE